MAKNCEKKAASWFKALGGIKKVLKVGNFSDKDNILTVQYKQRTHIGNKPNIILEITPCKR